MLVARRELFRNRVPSMPGGGTVAYVNPFEHVYLTDIEHREEGGTPAIVESIRAGLVFELKAAVGVDAIREREEDFIRRALAPLGGQPLDRDPGQPQAERLSIVSFVVRHDGRYLHHNFVVALLNDLFGIQSRGGCSCAGPYGHRLLGIDLETSHEFEREITRGCEGIKPGWVRVNFNYFISEAVFEFILDAVDLVATEGWRLLPDYAFEPATGLWRHRAGRPEPPRACATSATTTGAMDWPSHRHHEPESRLAEYLDGGARDPGRARSWRRRRRRSPPARWARTSRPCAGSCCPRTWRPRPTARVAERRVASRRSSGWTSGRPRRRRRWSGSTGGCSGWGGPATRRTSAPTGGPSRIPGRLVGGGVAAAVPLARRARGRRRRSPSAAWAQGPTLAAVDADGDARAAGDHLAGPAAAAAAGRVRAAAAMAWLAREDPEAAERARAGSCRRGTRWACG